MIMIKLRHLNHACKLGQVNVSRSHQPIRCLVNQTTTVIYTKILLMRDAIITTFYHIYMDKYKIWSNSWDLFVIPMNCFDFCLPSTLDLCTWSSVRFKWIQVKSCVHMAVLCPQMWTNVTEPTTVTRTRIARTLEAATRVSVKMDTWATEKSATVSSRW